MCEYCGCSITDHSHPFAAKPNGAGHHLNDSGHEHSGRHAGNPALQETETVEILENILHENNHQANHIREHFNKKNILALNVMGSPGSGKTSLLEATARDLDFPVSVIEGDLETTRDADRMKAAGINAWQIQTGNACHLDAFMVHDALHKFELPENSLLFVENVGNLVCPAVYDIGAHVNIVLLSVTEGDDKVAKYPVMFKNAGLLVITKTDLLPHVDFSIERVKAEFRKLNTSADIITLSTKSGENTGQWNEYINMKRKLHA